MASFSILGTLEATQIMRAVPPNLRGVVRMTIRDGEHYHVILFAHDEEHGVTTSAGVRRALRRVPANVKLLAVGRDFTQEANALLLTHGADIARAGGFGWTDASYLQIRNRDF